MLKVQKKRELYKRLFYMAVTGVIFIFISSGFIRAEDKEKIESLRGLSLSQAYSFSLPAEKAEENNDSPDISKIKEQLHEWIDGVKDNNKDSRQSSAGYKAEPRNQSDETGTESLIKKIHYHPVTKTPRQIKLNVTSSVSRARSASDKKEPAEAAREFLRNIKGILRIKDTDTEMKLCREESDNLNRQHIRFSQTYKDLPVYPSDLIIHLNSQGDVEMMDGAFVPTPSKLVIQPVLNADDAVQKSRRNVPEGESGIPGEPELIIYAPGDRLPRLAWKLEISVSLQSKWLVIIDALNGACLTAYNQVKSGSESGSGTDLFGDKYSLNLWEKSGTYYMVDTSKPMYNAASSAPPHPDTTSGAIIILDAQNKPSTSNVQSLPFITYVTSGNPDSGWLSDAVSAAHNISETYDYYKERHNRNSVDGKGGTILGIVRVGLNYKNAGWGSDMMIFGDAMPFAGALDVVAHEMTHGVTAYSANLIYKNQPGALNEAFSDIFGEAVEAYSQGSADWINGTKIDGDRNLKSPSSVRISGTSRYYPSKMSDFIDSDDSFLNNFTDRDNGGVHLNMTIVSHAFYLLAEGMNGAIGIKKAEQIFYRALAYHLVSNSQFIDARLACIASAEELFDNSDSAVKTAEAFDAVEISDDEGTPEETPSLTPVSGDDLLLFVYYDSDYGIYLLGRRESDDPEEGVKLSSHAVKLSRPSISRDGTFGVFVSEDDDLCFIETGGMTSEECLGFNGLIKSAAMSPDGNLYGFVFSDRTGETLNSISVIDLETDTTRTFELVSPTLDGVSTNTILYADAMNFTSDNKYIIYDAYNVVTLNDGTEYGAWSIYAIDLETEQTLALMPPVRGYDIGFPALSQTNDSFITFDAYSSDTGVSTVYAFNMINGELKEVAVTNGEWGYPYYTGDDKAIIYSDSDSDINGHSIWRQSLNDDRLTSAGNTSLFLSSAELGIIYRKGTSGGDDDDSGGDSVDANGGGGGGCFIATAASDPIKSLFLIMFSAIAISIPKFWKLRKSYSRK